LDVVDFMFATNCRAASSRWFASSSQCRVTRNFTFFLRQFFCFEMAPDNWENGAQHGVKWHPIRYKMVPNVVFTNLIAGCLYPGLLYRPYFW